MIAAIVGMGVALVDVPRFAAALERHGERMRARLFTRGERRYAGDRARAAQSLAVRFAAKLAGRRALGLGGSAWSDLEIVREPGRAPTLQLRGPARARARELGVRDVALTLTHDAACCIGHVVLESADE